MDYAAAVGMAGGVHVVLPWPEALRYEYTLNREFVYTSLIAC